jgi:class I fructose-bisphosphate aldolase
MTIDRISELLGADAQSLLNHVSKTVSKDLLHLPGADFIDREFVYSNRNPQVLRSLSNMYNHGRLSDTGYLSILPVDQGIEHTAGASFAPNPI